MVELIILQSIDDIILEPEKEESHFKRSIIRRDYERENSLELLDKFKKFAQMESLEVLDLYQHLGETEVEFIDFILKERIRKVLNYKFLLDLGDGFYHLFLPECPPNFSYNNMIIFKSNLEMLETDMIRFINKQKKDKIFNHFSFQPQISIDCKVEKKIELIKEFIDLFSMSENDLYRINFDTIDKSSRSINDLKVLIGYNKIYISIKGKPSNLEFLLFVKEYFSRF